MELTSVSNKHEHIEKEQLMGEIQEALQQWESAKRFFNYATGHEQVDYAIHAIITAEKRYAMLLGRAKRMQGPWPIWTGGIK